MTDNTLEKVLSALKELKEKADKDFSGFVKEIRDRLHVHDKRIGNLESEVKCNISGITYNSKRIDALEEAGTEKFAHPDVIGRIEHLEKLCGKKYIEGLGNLGVNVMDVKDLPTKITGLTFEEAITAMKESWLKGIKS